MLRYVKDFVYQFGKKKNKCAIESTQWPLIIRKVVVYEQRKKDSYNEEA